MIPLMLAELTTVPGSALPVQEFAQHLRLSRGFADDGELDAHLETCLRSALAAIEARAAKALFRRQFSLSVSAWSASDRHVLPIAPVVAVEDFRIVARDGTETAVDPGAFDLVADMHRPAIAAVSGTLPVLRPGSSAEIALRAGYSEDWAGMPPDLQQAVLLLAGEFFGQDVEAERGLPVTVSLLIEPFRALRLRGAGQ